MVGAAAWVTNTPGSRADTQPPHHALARLALCRDTRMAQSVRGLCRVRKPLVGWPQGVWLQRTNSDMASVGHSSATMVLPGAENQVQLMQPRSTKAHSLRKAKGRVHGQGVPPT